LVLGSGGVMGRVDHVVAGLRSGQVWELVVSSPEFAARFAPGDRIGVQVVDREDDLVAYEHLPPSGESECLGLVISSLSAFRVSDWRLVEGRRWSPVCRGSWVWELH
jgi:hypothetical protein